MCLLTLSLTCTTALSDTVRVAGMDGWQPWMLVRLSTGHIAHADEAEQVAIVEGACALLMGQPMYRIFARQPAALAAVAAALMGSSGHASPQAVQALSQAFITFAMGFIRPPMLEYCQVC